MSLLCGHLGVVKRFKTYELRSEQPLIAQVHDAKILQLTDCLGTTGRHQQRDPVDPGGEAVHRAAGRGA